jgi:hypothetical protein
LITTVQPAASAGATLRVIMAFGKFHGVMMPHTPDRLLQDHDAAVGRGRWDRRCTNAPGLFREPLGDRVDRVARIEDNERESRLGWLQTSGEAS